LFLFINFIILVSINFENIDGKEIGKERITYAFLKVSGKVSSCIHSLNNFISMSVKTLLTSFTNLEGISSGSCAEYVLILLMQVLTSSLL